MKAIGVLVHGGPEALEIINVPEVNVGPGEIRIKNQASGVNPTDVGVRDGRRQSYGKNIHLRMFLEWIYLVLSIRLVAML